MKNNRRKSGIRKFIIAFIIIIIIGVLGLVYELYSRVYHPNVLLNKASVEKYIYIPTNSSFKEVVDILSQNGLLINTSSFVWLAKQEDTE